jgi:E3 ubiquitin-protein ligase LRSAM1
MPEDFASLTSLKALYLQNNKIKQLPNSIGDLKNLQTLNVSGNNMKELPTTLSSLGCLKSLDISNNSKLVKLPKELGNLRSLETLTLDTDVVTYPSKDVTKDGTEAIMRFFCSELGIDYISPQDHIPEKVPQNGSINGKCNIVDPYEELIKNHLAKEEKIKEVKKENARILERQMMETQERESELKKLNEENRKKLIDDLAMEENKKEAEIMKIQKIRDDERKILNSRMMQAEQQSDFLIKELMESHSSLSDHSKVMEALEEDKRKMEAQLTVVKEDAEKLREKDVLRKLLVLPQRDATISVFQVRF